MKFILLASAAGTLLAAASPASAQTSDSWTGPYVGGRLGLGFQPKDKNETILFDTNLDGSFGDTVNTAAGTNAFSPGFCGGAASAPSLAAAARTTGTGLNGLSMPDTTFNSVAAS